MSISEITRDFRKTFSRSQLRSGNGKSFRRAMSATSCKLSDPASRPIGSHRLLIDCEVRFR